MQQQVRETLADPEQKKLYSKMATEVFYLFIGVHIMRVIYIQDVKNIYLSFFHIG